MRLPLLPLLLASFAARGALGFQPQGVDPYEVLGLKRGDPLDAATLKRAYRKAALRWHPDKVSEEEKEEAEKNFIEIAWSYEVLSDPARRSQFEASGNANTGSGSEAGRDFSMEEAARVFRTAFGTTSSEYQDLIQHLMASSSSGNKARWQQHAEAIARELKNNKDGDFTVETAAKDGTERMTTSQKVSRGDGTVTKTTVTKHTQQKSSSGGSNHALEHGTHHPALQNVHQAHQAAHEAAVKAAAEAHRKAIGGLSANLPPLGHTEL
mmetsp:Transcript_99157/g.196510  ORF Transcript_99157/g.196510 Transcript_99157/m.196510 type:complete len:267 (+) Transcript_99157:64-864(+)